MRITFLPNHWFRLRWSLLSIATFAGLHAVGHYAEITSQPVAPESSTVGLVKQETGKSFLRGSISGLLPEAPLFAADAPRGNEFPISLGSMDRAWRKRMAARSSSGRPQRATFWGFVTGADATESDTEYGLVVGESLDEAFFREMRMQVAKRRRQAGPENQAPSEEALTASAILRAALIANFANQAQQELPAETDFWLAQAQAALVPINVQSEGGASTFSGGSAGGTTGISTGNHDATSGSVSPPSFLQGPMAGYPGAVASRSAGNFPALARPFPAAPPSQPVSYALAIPSGQRRHHHSSVSFDAHGMASHGSPAAPSPAVDSTNSDAGPDPKATVASSSVVASRTSGSLVVRHASLASPASASAADSKSIYVANIGSGIVNEYDQATGTAVGGFTPIALSNVRNVALVGNTLYVGTFTGSGTISTYNAATGAAINSNLVTGINQLEGMIVSGNTIYVTSFGSGVLAFDATTGASVAGFHPPAVSGPRGIAISGNRLYVVSTSNNLVFALDATTGAVIPGFTSPSGLSQASAVAVSGNTLYIADVGSGHIGEYDATTGATTNSQFLNTSGTITQLSIWGTDLYVPNLSASTVGVFDITTGLPDPNYTAPSGLNNPWSVAAIPEPGSMVLLAAGATALLGSRRRRVGIQVTA